MNLTKRKIKKLAKLNLIPIMDAVFIFIFFLLMSAQFLEIREISSDAPSVAEVEVEKMKKEPLNLMLEISDKTIKVKTGFDANLKKTFTSLEGEFNLDAIQAYIVSLKSQYIEEETVVLKPDTTVAYEKIVQIMDTVRSIKYGKTPVVGKNTKGETIQTNVLFDKIVFDAVI